MSSCLDFSFFYGDNQAVKDVTLDFPSYQVTAIIGPSGCGKSTLLRAINRMNDLIPGGRTVGQPAFRRPGDLWPAPGRGRPAPAHRHGLSEAQPVPQVHFRQHRLRPAPARPPGQGGTRRRSSRPACSAPRSGTRSRTAWTTTPWAFPAGSSSACASPGPWPSIRKYCSWTSRPRPWTRGPRRASRT